MTEPAWRTLHRDAIVADAHNDLLCAVVARPVPQWGTFFRTRWLPQLREGGVDLQVLPVFIDDAFRPEGALRQTFRMIECAHRIVAANADAITLCGESADIDAALASARIAAILALESAPGVGEDVELLQTLHRLGVRIASLAHFGRSPLADGSAEDATGSRLTQAGVAAVELMQQFGMIVDVSHLNTAGVEHVLEITTRPIIATHSSARALRDHHRNLTDAQLTGIAARGGVVCVNFFAPYLHESDHTMDRLIDHLEHVVSVVGADHTGLGPDFVEEVITDTTPRWCDPASASDGSGIDSLAYIKGLEGPAGLPLLTEALVRRGWSNDQVEAVLGQSLYRFLRRELGPAPARPFMP